MSLLSMRMIVCLAVTLGTTVARGGENEDKAVRRDSLKSIEVSNGKILRILVRMKEQQGIMEVQGVL
jgi:hypothetical protein